MREYIAISIIQGNRALRTPCHILFLLRYIHESFLRFWLNANNSECFCFTHNVLEILTWACAPTIGNPFQNYKYYPKETKLFRINSTRKVHFTDFVNIGRVHIHIPTESIYAENLLTRGEKQTHKKNLRTEIILIVSYFILTTTGSRSLVFVMTTGTTENNISLLYSSVHPTKPQKTKNNVIGLGRKK